MPNPLSRSGLDLLSRRQFLGHTGVGLGGIALAHLLEHAQGGDADQRVAKQPICCTLPPHQEN